MRYYVGGTAASEDGGLALIAHRVDWMVDGDTVGAERVEQDGLYLDHLHSTMLEHRIPTTVGLATAPGPLLRLPTRTNIRERAVLGFAAVGRRKRPHAIKSAADCASQADRVAGRGAGQRQDPPT